MKHSDQFPTLQYVSPNTGLITSPGKFEGERIEVVAAYEQYLDGFAEDDGEVVKVELPSGEIVCFVEDEQGFICEVTQ